ncbi:McrB family protein [Paenibacillus amylolyticus]|uniref:McrB family protein n=1 Tax=Paenibacillus amylolyticus TaxID=1451 RepID=UPI002499F596|nr:hypothetical protein [Paenibacillus amylolyticus]WFA83390.1 hypothetical protein OGI70_20485 [Paenibacillus amylolyticus]
MTKIDPAKPYLGSLPIEVEFYCGEEKRLSWQLTMRCMQNTIYPSLEDGEGGYAFLIKSSKSGLLFRAMQAAKYVQDGERTIVTISTDLNSKKGDAEFRQNMQRALTQYAPMLEHQGGRLLEPNQFAFIDYDSESNEMVQDGQSVLSSALLLATMKAVFKGELNLTLPTIFGDKTHAAATVANPIVWKVTPGSQAVHWPHALEDRNIFIGWSELGDLTQYATKEQLRERYNQVYDPQQEPSNNMDSIWGFYKDMKPGDIVIANKGWKELTGIGRVMGEYEYDSGEDDFPHLRKVEWVITAPVKFEENVFTTPTVTRVLQKHMAKIRQEVVSQVPNGEKLWHDLFGASGELDFALDRPESLVDNFHRYLQSCRLNYSREFVGRFITSLQAKPFLILSGGSGTGKTKIAQHFAAYMNENNAVMSSSSDIPDEDRAKSFLLQLLPYMFEYQRMIVTVEMLEWVTLDGLEDGVKIEVRFGDQTETSFMKRQGKTVRLGFRKHFMAWLKNECRIGDSLRLTIEEEGKVFAYSKDNEMSQQLDENLAFVSVRPDWLDNRSLLGYYNPLIEQYEPTPLLKLMLRAEQNPGKPYFVILDEMNLAKVEYYFSDFLSCLESRRCDEAGFLKQEAIVLHQLSQPLEHVDESNRVYVIPSKVHIPMNVYLIGTVNIDETTYMFSPKVLDRANVLECNEVDFQSYWNSGGESLLSSSAFVHKVAGRSGMFANEGEYHLALYRKGFLNPAHKPSLQEAFEVISELQEMLTEEGLPFGYRVLDEIMTYLMMALQSDSGNLESALDAQIVQKILPKLHGNRKQLELLLRRLLDEFTIGTLKSDPLSLENREILAMEESYRFPLSGKKVYAMYKQLLQTAYCSFIC